MRRGSVTLYDGSPLLWVLLALAGVVVIFLLGGYKESVSSWTIAQYGDEGPRVTIQKSDLEQMSRVQVGEVKVYYAEAAMQAVAEQIAGALVHSYALVKERLGWQPEAAGVVLIGGEKPREVKIEGIIEENPLFAIWLPPETMTGGLTQASEDVLSNIYWVMPHEATEPVLSSRLYHDCGARWVGDGLGDYGGYIVSGQFSPAVQQAWLKRRLRAIEILIEQGKKSYNLPQEFQAFRRIQILFIRLGCQESPRPVMVAGYAVSLAIWLDLVDKHGEDVIRKFWQELQQIPRPGNREVFRILSALTGEDIKAKITHVDLQHAAEVLRRHLH